MKINVDEIIARVLPWECELTIGGKVYRVRPPTLADVDTLMTMSANQQLSEQKTAELVRSLFDEPRPDLVSMTLPTVNLVTQVVLRYIHDYLAPKNAEALQAAAGLTKNGTVGNTSSPSALSVPGSPTP